MLKEQVVQRSSGPKGIRGMIILRIGKRSTQGGDRP